MDTEKRVYIITGTPGVGKTTVSMVLAEFLGAYHVNLSEFAANKHLITGHDESMDTSIVDIEKLKKEMVGIIDSFKGSLIIEGHYSHDIIPSKSVSMAFVLRRAPWVLEKELQKRGYSPEKVKENVEAELINVCLSETVENIDSGKVCEIDSTWKDVEQVVGELVAIIEGRKPCCFGYIDWLSRSETEDFLR
jgi:adenylate kinase